MTLLLCIDVGNTHMVFGLFSGERLVHQWRLPTDRDATADDLAVRLNGLLALHDVDPAAVDGVAVCCVVPPLSSALAELGNRYLGQQPLFVDAAVRTGVAVRYDNPNEVGADRIVNAAAAYRLYGGPAVVVDFGTATTFDAVSATGEYLGGAISPGIGISLEALFQRASMLPRIHLQRPERAIGTNTVASMQSGVVYGYAGQVDAMVQRIRAELGGRARTIATGGFAELIAPSCETIETIDPSLTLHGLRLIYNLNHEER